MLINLGVGIKQKETSDENAMDINGEGDVGENGEGEGEEDDMYGHKALLSTIVEEMEERLTEEDMMSIFRIMDSNLGSGQ